MTHRALPIFAGLALAAILISPAAVRADEPASPPPAPSPPPARAEQPAAPAPAPVTAGPMSYEPPSPELWKSAGAPLAPRRSESVMWTGVALEVVGGLVLFTGAMWDLSTVNLAAGTSPCGPPFSCPANNPTGSTTGPIIMMVAGAVGVVAGIPLLVYGAPRVPEAAGKPTASGWGWRF